MNFLLTDLMRLLRDEEWTLYNRERQKTSRDHKALDLISILSTPRTPLTVASQDRRPINPPQQVIELNCLLCFVNFSLTELQLLQIHFL